ncbi:SMP-30/gluconolactonase/LRE family protein [Sphingomonas turrisvirgatae]|uniref:Gluconolaconase n=1 Tax=Sphingomonas turrisvirgatae TaxID=1888892 RepID=A0A1E3M0Y7_9SPHN|nr:SMP-30/gluconolactonase/LRE family protein [Sphingomonas turrisvirgatae]ODP38700.1 gluconolaconase [Sphingomonas turrisvirgatae]
MTSVVHAAPAPVWALDGPLLEGPVWVERDAALWFVDIKSHRIHRFRPNDGERQSWAAPAQIGFCLPAADGRFVAGLQTGLVLFDPADGSFTPLLDPEPDLPGNRLNDAAVDPSGRLWFGTMDDAEEASTGRIWRLDEDRRCAAVSEPVAISNGPAFSPDGRTIYHVDTLGGTIYAASVAADGTLTDTRIFARIAPADGYPDGPTVDAEGCVWIGLYNGHAVRRYSPAGELLESIAFPVSAITKVAFGGPDLRTLYATTAAKHLDAAGRTREPLAGALFACPVDVPGLPAPTVTVGL